MDTSALSKHDAVALYQRSKSAMARARREAEEQGEEIAQTFVQVLSGASFGMAEEYFGERAVFGADIPAVIGAGAGLAAIFGVGGNGMLNGSLRAVGNAGMTITSYKFGGRMMAEWSASRPAEGGGR